MSKLAQILEELKKKYHRHKHTKIFDKKTTFFSKERRKTVLILLTVLFFIASVFGGYLIVNIVNEIANKQKRGPKELVMNIASPKIDKQVPPTQPVKPLSPQEVSKTEEKRDLQDKGPKNIKQKMKEKKITEKKQREQKRITKKTKPNVIAREEKTQNKRKKDVNQGKVVVHSPQEGPPILRDDGLLNNLLLNAEEGIRNGNYQLAKFFYEKYLEKKVEPDVLNNYGTVLYLLGDYEGAKKAFSKALKLKDHPTYRLNLILTKLRLNEIEEACRLFKAYQSSLQSFPESESVKKYCQP